MNRNAVGTYYHLSSHGKKLCDGCYFKNPWQNYCKRFNKNITRITQRNGGFHHKPCLECKNFKLNEVSDA